MPSHSVLLLAAATAGDTAGDGIGAGAGGSVPLKS